MSKNNSTKEVKIATTFATAKPRLNVDFQVLADLGQQRSFRKDTIIVNEGEIGDDLYILIQGRVRVFNADTSGKEITLGTVLPGEFFGEMSLDGGTRTATVEALEPCLCAIVPNTHVLAFVRDNSEFAISLLQTTIARARVAIQAKR